MATFRVFGLGVESGVVPAALAGLPPVVRVEMRWHLGWMPEGYDAIAPRRWRQLRGGDASRAGIWQLDGRDLHRLVYADNCEFAVAPDGSEIWGRWPAESTLEDAATYLLGPVTGYALGLRGTACLHASAVAIGGKAILFAGHAGHGKSSIAAAFARLGFPVLTDDVAALALNDGCIEVQPAYPRVRLWPDSVQAMFGSAESLPRITPTWEKRFLALGNGAFRFQDNCLPLGAVFIIEERCADPGPRISRPDPVAALLALIGHGYSGSMLPRTARAREFGLMAELVRQVPVARVAPSDDLRNLPQLGEAILDYLDSQGARDARPPHLAANAAL
jgi:hypothetical protein